MTERISPVAADDRIGSLDFLRGLAVLGILIINIESFAYPDPWSPYKYGYATPSDHDVRFWVYFLVQGKFFSMFTLLFGVGFCLFTDRLSKKGPGLVVAEIYGRRMLILFLIGVAHAYLIWDGDVLYHYAICGLLLFPFRSFRTSGLLITILILIAVVGFNAWQITLRNATQKADYELAKSKKPELRNTNDDKAISRWEKKTSKKGPDKSQVDVPRKTYWLSIQENASHQKVHKGALVYQGILFRTMIMMLLGMLFYRMGIFQDFRSMKGYWPFTLLLLSFALIINYGRFHHWTYAYHQPVTGTWLGLAYAYPKELLGLAYALLFNGLYQQFSYQWKPIVSLGRMALTNYLTQSVICGLIFYGYGLAFHNQFPRSILLLIVLSIWLIQIPLSIWVIDRFGQGPVEKWWRRWTYRG